MGTHKLPVSVISSANLGFPCLCSSQTSMNASTPSVATGPANMMAVPKLSTLLLFPWCGSVFDHKFTPVWDFYKQAFTAAPVDWLTLPIETNRHCCSSTTSCSVPRWGCPEYFPRHIGFFARDRSYHQFTHTTGRRTVMQPNRPTGVRFPYRFGAHHKLLIVSAIAYSVRRFPCSYFPACVIGSS